MQKAKSIFAIIILPCLLLYLQLCPGRVFGAISDQIKLPPRFGIEVFQNNLPGARSMALSPSGTLFVGTMEEGKVYAVKDKKIYVLAKNLNMPNGVALRGNALYVAEVSRVIRYDDIENRLSNPPAPVVVNDTFPHETHHGWKFIRFSPDGWLYVPVGAPCNVCKRDDKKYASIMRMRPDGSGLEVFASGVRNSVGFDWDPTTGDLWFTDNGRDMLGDDIPPDELNHAHLKGMHFGFPFCHGGTVADPEFGREQKCSEFTAPEAKLGAHVASLGMRFYTGSQFPKEYRNQIFIAEHGSWNRTKKSGYRIQVAFLKNGHVDRVETFADGWMKNEVAWGRPVDVQVAADGSLLVSDDLAGAIYRIFYK